MISKITIGSFKPIVDMELELGRVNVFIGANGSGKTNILEAIGVLSAAARGRVDEEALLRRGVRLSGEGRYLTRLSQVPTGSTVSMKADWKRDAGTAGYEVELEPPVEGNVWRYAQERAMERARVILDRASAANGSLDPEAGWAALKMVELPPSSAAKALMGWLSEYALHAATTPALRGTVPDLQQREPLGLSGGGLAEAVLILQRLAETKSEPVPNDLGQSLPQVVHDQLGRYPSYVQDVLRDATGLVDWAAELGVEERTADLIAAGVPSGRLVLFFRDRFMDPRWQKLGAYECSEGALYVLQAAVLGARISEPWLFAIDDFDHALNPRLARALMERFCAWVLGNPAARRQAVLTTHNPLILDGLDLTNDGIRLFTVGRTNKGRTVARRVVVDQELMEKSEGVASVAPVGPRGDRGCAQCLRGPYRSSRWCARGTRIPRSFRRSPTRSQIGSCRSSASSPSDH